MYFVYFAYSLNVCSCKFVFFLSKGGGQPPMRAMKFWLDTGDFRTEAVLVHNVANPIMTRSLTKEKRKGTEERGPGCANSSHPAHQQLAKGGSEIAVR